jgi:hypothetical protein
MQDLYHGFHPNDDSSVFVFIAGFAAAQLLLSQLPTMSHLRHLNMAAVVCTAAYVIIVSIECIKNGELNAQLVCARGAGSICICHQVTMPCQVRHMLPESVPMLPCVPAKRCAWCVGSLSSPCCRQGHGPEQSQSQARATAIGWSVHAGGARTSITARGIRIHDSEGGVLSGMCHAHDVRVWLAAPVSSQNSSGNIQAFESVGIFMFAFSNPIMPGAQLALALSHPAWSCALEHAAGCTKSSPLLQRYTPLPGRP